MIPTKNGDSVTHLVPDCVSSGLRPERATAETRPE